MAPMIALAVSFLFFWITGLLGWSYFAGWQHPLQAGVAVMFLLTASAHWGKRRPDLTRMVPSVFPRPELMVTITGWLEIAGATGILIPATSRAAAICLTLMLIAMFPANVKAAREKITIGGRPTPPLFVRTILQIVFLTAVLLAGFG
ncbi:DoxX family protein [Brevibacillus ruminantium]|uniref:DoxX family protein n=1 Tax=Brevibacillus ruminantium TaxID=2950604 RepID=A0ABY4WMV8_9BACL|nr:DoxX family protein [Brevibacillus ruminantium]USG67463.1 DoxX family protein [Brevibacillus ruminantium]